MTLLDGFAMSNFRSFRGPLQYVGPLTKLNLLAGPNNSGKSNVLRFAHQVLGPLNGNRIGSAVQVARLQGFDIPIGTAEVDPRLALAITIDRMAEQVGQALGDSGNGQFALHLRETLLTAPFFARDDGLIWLEYDIQRRDSEQLVLSLSGSQLEAAIETVSPQQRSSITEASGQLTQTRGGGKAEDLRRVLDKVLDLIPTVPPVQTIDAFRQIRPADESTGHSGGGLIQALARLESPNSHSPRSPAQAASVPFCRDKQRVHHCDALCSHARH